MLTSEQLEEIRERESKATPGPWSTYHCTMIFGGDDRVCSIETEDGDWIAVSDCSASGDCLHDLNKEDSKFIAHARQDIPALLETIEKLKKQATETRKKTLEEAIKIVEEEFHCSRTLPPRNVAGNYIQACINGVIFDIMMNLKDCLKKGGVITSRKASYHEKDGVVYEETGEVRSPLEGEYFYGHNGPERANFNFIMKEIILVPVKDLTKGGV